MPDDAGFWSVTKAEDVHTVSRAWETFSSASNVVIAGHMVPVEIIQGMFIEMDPPKHDRINNLSSARSRRGRLHSTSTRSGRSRHGCRTACRARDVRAGDRRHPVVAQVICSLWAWTLKTTGRGLRRSAEWPASVARS
jgi:hypothetical protein